MERDRAGLRTRSTWFMDPRAVLELVRHPQVGVLGHEVGGSLERVMPALQPR